MSILGLSLALCLGLVHIFASRTPWLERIPQRGWISLAGGISIAYIFLDIFPELSHAQAEVAQGTSPAIAFLENHVYLLALAGLLTFYGLEKLARRSRYQHQQTHGEDRTQSAIFWLHITSFAIYNAILGYLLRESENHGLTACLLLFFTLALHFVVNDVGLREHHKRAYDRLGRWLLAGAILLGWILGQAQPVNAAAIATIWAFMAGGIVLNVLKEELPAKEDSNFPLFVTGAAVYTVILLAASVA